MENTRKKRIWPVILCTVGGVVLLAVLIVVFSVMGIFSRMRQDLVETVAGPSDQQETAQIAAPTADPFAEALSTDTDYYETGEITKVPIYSQDKIDRFITSILVVVKNGSVEDNGNQTDMIFVVSWNALLQKFTVVAIPRDTLVPLGDYGWKRINAAYTYGDRGMLINTINDVFGLDIQNYVLTGTDELAKMADEVGGIPATLTDGEAAYLNGQLGCALSAGKQKLSGEQIIAYLLDRTSDGKGSLGRADCQLKVIRGTFKYLTETFDETFLRPFMNVVTKGIRSNMDFELLTGIGYEMVMSDDLSFVTLRMPFDGCFTEMTYDGGYAILPEFEKNRILLEQALYGKE